jgi:hypothetical protein
LLYSSNTATASLSPDFISSALFFIHLCNHSEVLRFSISPSGGPTNFASSLWQAAQFCLNISFPLIGSPVA